MGKDIHVVKHGSEWAAKKAGAERASIITPTQKESIDWAKQQAQKEKSEVIIHGENGQIRERNTYKKDPYPPKG